MTPPLSQRFTNGADSSDLCRAMMMLQTSEEMEAFMKELCSVQELKMLSERWSIAKLINMGFSYRIIGQKTGASSATIARLSQSLARGTGEILRTCKRREEALARQFNSHRI
jgi:TrpR-related protein YerC/YecD